MKRHWKKILAASVTTLLIVGGYLIYIFQFKEYDIADKEVAEITEETYKLELPDGSAIELDKDGNVLESEDTTSGTKTADSSNSSAVSTSSNETSESDSESTAGSSSDSSKNGSSSNSGSSNSGSTETTPSNSETEKVTVAAIKGKYSPTMSSLQSQANGRINALIGRAIEEYQNKKANGDSVNYAYFYNKYTSAATELEGRTDTVFYQVVGVIEKELVANGYSKSHSQSFVESYETAKEDRRSALLDKAINR